MQIGFVGLGKMGGNMVRRILRDSNHGVVAFDRNPDNVRAAGDAGALEASSVEDLVRLLQPPRVVWVMVPAGTPTQQVVDLLAELLEPGDVVVDGGNTRWTDDKARAAQVAGRGIEYVDAGTSGGVWGLQEGYSLMVGGSENGVARVAPILDVLAPPGSDEHGPGWAHLGPTGAGHYVKMIHNGIEYGLMQAYAEGFEVFDKSEYDLDKARIARVWMKGSVVRSWLLELALRAFEQEGDDLAGLDPWTADSGEGRWTVEEAIARDVPTPVMSAALYARFYSRGNGDFTHRLLAALRAQFGGHATRSQADESTTR
jgi:6-phosphogluconate dehydrogenase